MTQTSYHTTSHREKVYQQSARSCPTQLDELLSRVFGSSPGHTDIVEHQVATGDAKLIIPSTIQNSASLAEQGETGD